MAEYSAALSWVVILGCLFVCGLIIMMITPLTDAFFVIGANAGADPQTLEVIHNSFTIYLPVVVIFGIITYGYRKSRNRIA
jgi:hypothetical protein